MKQEKGHKIKICFVCSSGGHFEELMCLKDLFSVAESYLLTESQIADRYIPCKKIYRLKEINRREKHFYSHFLRLFFKTLKIHLKERPTVILSTGALCAVPALLVGKLFNCKIVYIESFARVTSLSTTGKIASRIADVFYVQWESLLSVVPNAKYCGSLF